MQYLTRDHATARYRSSRHRSETKATPTSQGLIEDYRQMIVTVHRKGRCRKVTPFSCHYLMTSPDPMMPSNVVPVQTTLAKQSFSNPDWLFEPKWDGYRAICFLSERRSSLCFEESEESHRKILGSPENFKSITTAVLDGEIVALDEAGVPCFDSLRTKKSTGCQIVCYAFDLLYV